MDAARGLCGGLSLSLAVSGEDGFVAGVDAFKD